MAGRSPDFLRYPPRKSLCRGAFQLKIGSQHHQACKWLNPSDGKFGEIIVGGDGDSSASIRSLRLLPIAQTRPIFDRPQHIEVEFTEGEDEAARATLVREQFHIAQAAIKPS